MAACFAGEATSMRKVCLGQRVGGGWVWVVVGAGGVVWLSFRRRRSAAPLATSLADGRAKLARGKAARAYLKRARKE